MVTDSLPSPVFHQNRYAVELDRLVVPGCRWLDVGAGKEIHGGWEGPSSAKLASRASFLAGIDPDEQILENPWLHDARLGNAASLPWPDESFDLVTANMVIEHLEDPLSVFREVQRVLKPGGAFAFVTPNRMHPVVRTAAVLAPPQVRRWYGTNIERREERDVFVTFYRANTVPEIVSFAARAGLLVEVCEAFVNLVPILRLWPLYHLERMMNHRADRSRWVRLRGADLIAVLRNSRGVSHTAGSSGGASGHDGQPASRE